MKRTLLAATLGVNLVLSPVLTAHGAAASSNQIGRQRSEIDAIHDRIKRKREQLNFEELRERDFRRQLSETSTSISLVEGRLGALEGQIRIASGEEERDKRLLSSALFVLGAQREAFRHRITQMYEHPPDHYLWVLLTATSFVDFVERWDDLRYVVAEDQREVKARDAAVHRVAAARVAVAATLVRLQEDQQEQTRMHDQLGALVEERKNLVATVDEQRSSVAGEVHHLEEISAQEEAQLEQLVRAQEAEVERERAGAGTQAAAPRPPTAGQMLWPVSGPITSPFGMRLNPFGGGATEFHPGIDIAIPVGTSVAASAAGRVIIAGWVSGYGNYVAIDHGGGLSTGYGHLSQIFVGAGQDVQRGQVIGASGNTGRSTGPHLIFEVRRNGSPVDPAPFL